MNWELYKTEASRTFADFKKGFTPNLMDQVHCPIGMVTEIQELKEAQDLKPFTDDKVKLKNTNIREELGDILWYVANLERLIETPLYDLKGGFSPYPMEQLEQAAAEILDIYKKKLYYNRDIDYKKVQHLCKLVRAAVDSFAYLDKWTSEQLQQENIAKLKVRFPEKFTEDLANNRNTVAEYAAMDKKKNGK
jgi:NTP pyrophosphatase (non-canonical NTP hydrolase)